VFDLPGEDDSGSAVGGSLQNRIEDYVYSHKLLITLIFSGVVCLGIGSFYLFSDNISQSSAIEIVGETSADTLAAKDEQSLIVEISGAVFEPGVYSFSKEDRIVDAIAKAGGFHPDADIYWVEKTLNKASKLSDGQKIYIPILDKQTDVVSARNIDSIRLDQGSSSGINGETVNINSASITELDTLQGIGPVTAQNIIEQRPYSSINDLLTKKIVSQKVFDSIKDKISVY
jgi:competence protein ComEA